MISVQSQQVLHVLMYLGIEEAPMQTVEALSERVDIPHHYLGHIVRRLAKMGYLETKKGPNGGVKLGRDPSEIQLVSLLKDLGELEHESEGEPCCLPERLSACFVEDLFDRVREELEGVTLRSYIADHRAARSPDPSLERSETA